MLVMCRASTATSIVASIVSLTGALLAGCWLDHQRASRSEPLDAFVLPADASRLDSSRADASRLDASRADAARRDGALPDASALDAFAAPEDAPGRDARPPRVGCVDAADQFIRPADATVLEQIAAIDIDGDGASELLALDRGPSLHLFRFSGGSLVEAWTSPPVEGGGYPRALYGSDVDADGDLDVLASVSGLRVFENRGGELTEHAALSATPSSSGLEADDLEGDGDVDIVAGGDGLHEPPVRLLTQGASGDFTETTVGGPEDFSFAQMLHQGAGLPQLVVTAGVYTRVFGVHRGSGDSWAPIMTGETPDRLSGLAAADFDRDGLEDFVVIRSHDLGPSFYRQRAGRAFELAMEGNPAIGFAWANAVHDIDADGDPDLLVGAFSGTLWLYESTGGFTFAEHATSCTFSSEGIFALFSMTAGDFDGDGLVDMAVATNASVVVFLDVHHRLFGL